LVGGFFAKNEKTTNAFLLGGGKIPWWAASVSCAMSIMSTVSVVGIPGEAYNNGLRYTIIELFVPFTGLAFFYLFIRFYFMVKTYTPYMYLEQRFDARIRGIISVVFFLMRMSYLSLVLFSCAMVFKGIAEWNIQITILCIGIMAIAYCGMGGLKAVIWVNTIKFFALYSGILVTVIICLSQVSGGLFGVIKYAFENERGFSLNSDFFSFDPHVRMTLWLLLFSAIAQYMFLTSADQITIQQLLSTNSYKKAKNSFLGSILIMIPLVTILWFLGLCMFAYFGQNPVSGGNPPGDVALFRFIRCNLPSPLPGLIVATLLATAISTSGSALTALSTVAIKDFYLRFLRPNANEQIQVKASRILVIFIGLCAIGLSMLISIISRTLGETVFEAASIWMAASTVIAPVFFIGVVFPRCNGRHALIGILLGWLVTGAMVLWYIRSKCMGNPISFMAISVPGFITVLFTGFLAQICAKANYPHKNSDLTIWTLKTKS